MSCNSAAISGSPFHGNHADDLPTPIVPPPFARRMRQTMSNSPGRHWRGSFPGSYSKQGKRCAGGWNSPNPAFAPFPAVTRESASSDACQEDKPGDVCHEDWPSEQAASLVATINSKKAKLVVEFQSSLCLPGNVPLSEVGLTPK